jgi:hypothetical protein
VGEKVDKAAAGIYIFSFYGIVARLLKAIDTLFE